jgi:uncharacterized protein
MVWQNIQLIQQYKLPFTVLMVIGQEAIDYGAENIFRFFVDNGIRNFGLIASKPDNQPHVATCKMAPHYIAPPIMNQFLKEMYLAHKRHGDPSIRIRELAGIIDRMKGKSHVLCTMEGQCMGKYFLVEPNGDIAHCDLFLGDPRYTFGNVASQSFATIRTNPNLLELTAENAASVKRMKEACPEFSVCSGWCPHERYTSFRHNDRHSDTCCGLRDLIEFIREDKNA